MTRTRSCSVRLAAPLKLWQTAVALAKAVSRTEKSGTSLAAVPAAPGPAVPAGATVLAGSPSGLPSGGLSPAVGNGAAAVDNEIELAVVKSPIVGTFYRAPEPGSASFVEIGSTVRKGQVLCIIEAMKLMNEIDSEYDGEVVNIYVENGQPVQYGERLFAIRTK